MTNIKYFLSFPMITFVLLFSCTRENIVSQKKPHGSEISPKTEMAFMEIDTMKTFFCHYPEECERFHKATFLEKRRFEDKIFLNRMILAKNFLDSFPDDPKYFTVLKYFLHLNFEPHFISDQLSDELSKTLSNKWPPNTSAYRHQYKSLPIDTAKRAEWERKGRSLVAQFNKSNAPVEQKAEIENALFWREFRQALFIYQLVDQEKMTNETTFWNVYDEHFWEIFKFKMSLFMIKYSDQSFIADYVEEFISNVAKFSPHLVNSYWKDFREITLNENANSNNAGFKRVRGLAEANISALNELDFTKPLEMTFTDINGTKIDLRQKRGKVILLDFWTIRCAPCIKEMPHLQNIYKKYKDIGFEIYGIVGNGDEEKERVLEITKQQGATWPQYLDKGKNVNVSYHSLFKIHSYPTVWLLDKSGKIIDFNARGEHLEMSIRKELGFKN